MMNAKDALKLSLDLADTVVLPYLEDLTDAELLVRPVPGSNHIAWQLGHIIHSEHEMLDLICPGVMPALPPGFAERYSRDTAQLDSPSDFHTKGELLDLMRQVRVGTLKALAELPESKLEDPAPEQYRAYAPTVAAVIALQGTHWLMHAGQWAIIRRKLGRAPLF